MSTDQTPIDDAGSIKDLPAQTPNTELDASEVKGGSTGDVSASSLLSQPAVGSTLVGRAIGAIGFRSA